MFCGRIISIRLLYYYIFIKVLLFYVVLLLLTCWGTAISRDVGKSLKTLPYVTNSLVNLGKMDISFHFNARPQDSSLKSGFVSRGSSSFFSSKPESTIEEPCPCSNLKYLKDSSQNHPAEMLNKILNGNDLFSFKEPISSPLCCDSHEHVQEDILLEFGPKQSQIMTNSQNSFPFLPYILDSLQIRPTLPTMTAKPKAVEIFFFPKKRGVLPTEFDKVSVKNKINKDLNKKEAIKIVGDKEVRNDIKSLKFVPPFASSVKKDLALLDKTKHTTKKVDDSQTTIDKRIINVV